MTAPTVAARTTLEVGDARLDDETGGGVEVRALAGGDRCVVGEHDELVIGARRV